MLAAIVPHADEGWFFKLTGPAPAVADQREAFGKFIASVHFDEGEPRYAVPADWQAQGSAGMRYETFSIPSGEGNLQLAVTRLVKPPGDEQTYVVANINRWRRPNGLARSEQRTTGRKQHRRQTVGRRNGNHRRPGRKLKARRHARLLPPGGPNGQ